MGCAAIWMAVFTAFQVIIGGVGLFALFRTLRLTRDSVEKAGVSAEASERAAAAAIDAVSIARDTAERQLRAYVSCTKARLVDFTAGTEPYAMLTFRNAGSTPAQSITVMCHIYFRPHPPHYGDVIIRAPGRETSISLGPSQEVEIKDGALHGVGGPRLPRIDLDEERQLRAGNMAFYIHVDLRYRDIFGTRNTVEQRFMFTRDCLRRADGEADVCPYGNQHCYGLAPSAEPPANPVIPAVGVFAP
ncbi:hypothetical protein STVA_06940 [Allostella vacuolata]|nr:hypothetical protein STVA_06940 [Stella vacuolata]